MKDTMYIKACSKSKKNCVSTVNTSSYHQMEPISFICDASAAMNHLRNALHSMEHAEIAEQSENRLHAVFRSKVLKFKDDVEFFLEPREKKIHFRSASRIGYYDFGVNRKRMEEIRDRFGRETRRIEKTDIR
ncbi:DUF1499 domain-containing protein [Metabacillus idriensis]|uniref:DUF1499 domain-containing protein n=1 Tax=Metabacillus idriensis TaxID=324768 RepID=A0A6I2M7V5_9BACI|nr:DUF1499 domain-containing protein [Metabacillus idriensis]MCM3594538.1 DUF1499 domain-containing protein [Metabacillus idriensis]MRX53432.1 DUF1499 domain-containing protein [Metabacillus idriensis]